MIRVIAKFDVKPDMRATFLNGLRAVNHGTAKEDGAIGWDMYVAADDPNQFWVDERYRDQAAVDVHQSQPYIKDLGELAATALSEPPSAYMTDQIIHSESARKSVDDTDSALHMFFVLNIKEGTRDQVIDRFNTHIPLARAEQGCVLFDAFTVGGDPNTVLVHEIWQKPADLWETHFGNEYAQDTGKVLSQVVEGDLAQFMHAVSPIK